MTTVESGPRRSQGGRVVERGLDLAGYALARPGLTLVETARPGRRAFDTVVAQNAWNVVEGAEFRRLLARYPRGMRPTYRARRAVARVNLRRADRVVCLTEAMAALCERYSRRVEVAPLTVPLDLDEGSAPALPPGTALVPGTITWHKDPLAAVDVVREMGLPVTRLLYAGHDDGSGAWQQVRAAASAAGLAVERRTLTRAEMRAACASAEVVLVLSRLESLGFSMAESLAFGRRVVASPLPAHREVAARVGREPLWWTGQGGADVPALGAPLDLAPFADEWRVLGETLGLPRRDGVR